MKEKQYVNSPEVRAVLARVRKEQRLKQKQKANADSLVGSRVNLATDPIKGVIAVE